MKTLELQDKLLSALDEKSLGIIWFTKGDITNITPFHSVFDYLAEGRIKQLVEYSKQTSMKSNVNNFFITTCFAHPFIIFNTNSQADFSKSDFDDFKMILEKLDTTVDKKIFVVHPEDYNVPQIIKKSQFEVTTIVY